MRSLKEGMCLQLWKVHIGLDILLMEGLKTPRKGKTHTGSKSKGKGGEELR